MIHSVHKDYCLKTKNNSTVLTVCPSPQKLHSDIVRSGISDAALGWLANVSYIAFENGYRIWLNRNEECGANNVFTNCFVENLGNNITHSL